MLFDIIPALPSFRNPLPLRFGTERLPGRLLSAMARRAPENRGKVWPRGSSEAAAKNVGRIQKPPGGRIQLFSLRDDADSNRLLPENHSLGLTEDKKT